MKPKATLRHCLLLAAGSSLLAASHSQAASGTWNVNANGLWSTAGNWTPGIADGSGFTANFTNDITADRTVSLDSDRPLTSLVFGDSATGTAGSWILNNNGDSNNNLILAGTTPGITVNALGTNKTATISAIIEGTAGLVKSGTGTLILSGPNTYTGGTTISAGTIQATNSAALSTGTITLNGGGVLFSDVTLSNAIILNGGTLAAKGNTSVTYSGPITVNASTTSSVGNNGTGGDVGLSGNISGSGTVTTIGNWSVQLSGDNSGFTGTWQSTSAQSWFNTATAGSAVAKWVANGANFIGNIAGGGTVSLGELSGTTGRLKNDRANTTFTFSVGALNTNSSFSGLITDKDGDATSKTAITKVGSGTQTLGGTNTYTGNTTISNGALSITTTGALPGFSTSGRYSVANGATLAVYNAVTDANITSMLGTTNFAAGSSLGFDTTTAARTYNVTLSNTAQGALGLTKLGTNTLTLSGSTSNSYTGTTTLGGNGRILLAKTGGAIAIPGNINISSTTWNGNASGIVLAGDEQIADTSVLTWTTTAFGGGTQGISFFRLNGRTETIGGLVSTGTAGYAVIENRGFTDATVWGTGNLIINTTGSNSYSYNGEIRDFDGGTANTRIALTKTGSGTQTLSGGTTYTGGTRIDAGTLTLGHATDTLANTGAINVNGGTLDLGTNTDTVGAVTLTSGSITGSGTGTLTGSSYGVQSGSVSARLGGSGVALTKTTAGTVTLTGTNTYTGATTISGGTLALGASNVLPDVSDVTIGSGTLDVDTFDDTVDTLDVTGTAVINLGAGAHIVFAGGGTATWVGTLNITGTFVSGSSLNFGSSSGLSPAQLAAITVNGGGGPFTLDASGYLVAGGASPYDTWASGKGLTGLPGSSTDPAKDADPDGDGKNNLSEFAFDGNPLSGANDGKIVGKVATVGADQVLTLTLPVRTGATFLPDSGDQLSALIDGIYYRIEGDEALSTFADTITEVTGGDEVAIQAGLPGLSTGWTYRTFRAPGTIPTVPKAFLRAQISE